MRAKNLHIFGHAFRVRDAFVKYSRVWPTVNSIFPVLAKADWETFWKVLYNQLLEVRARNLSGNTTVSTNVNIHNNHHAGDSNNGKLRIRDN